MPDGLDVEMTRRVLRARRCEVCGTVWAPVPSRQVALAIAGELEDEEPRPLLDNLWDELYLTCCLKSLAWRKE